MTAVRGGLSFKPDHLSDERSSICFRAIILFKEKTTKTLSRPDRKKEQKKMTHHRCLRLLLFNLFRLLWKRVKTVGNAVSVF